MMLKEKVAVIYGAGGAIGGAVARAFASEGADLFVTGRSLAPVDVVAKDIVAAGGSAASAEVDALDEREVDQHLQLVIDRAGRVDISFNAVGIPNATILGVPLAELDVEQFSLPITILTTSYFLTARLAARRMVPSGSGVIMTVTAAHSRGASHWWEATVRRRRPKRHSPEICPPSSHRRASASSVYDHMPCRRRPRSGTPSSRAARHRG